ncbi:hypothetical protein Tco_0573039 [Tanacetum coccineum]
MIPLVKPLVECPAQPHTDDIHDPSGNDPNDYHLFIPQSYYETKEVSSDKDVDEWLNKELSKRMTRHDKGEEEDALIDILKTLGVSFIAEEEERDSSKTLPYQQPSNEINPGSFALSCTIGNLKIYVMADVGAGIDMMPKSLFKHLKLANLKKTSMAIEMVIDTLEEPDETILLGRPFLAMIHAQIDVFRGEILLGVGNENVKFDMNGEICHSRVPLEKIYMVSSIQESKDFNPHEMENDDSPAKNLSLQRGERRHYHERQNVGGNGMKFDDFLKVRYGNKNIDDVTRERRYYERITQNYDFKVKSQRTTKYTDTYDLHHKSDSPPNDTLHINTYFPDVSKPTKSDEFDKEIEQLVNEYELKAGRKRYALEEVWEKCEKFHDSTKQWYDEGFEEEELWQNGIEEIDYTPPLAKNETFEVHRYTFKNGKSFIRITKQMNDVLPLGRVNGSRFIEKTRKEMDEEGGATRKT